MNPQDYSILVQRTTIDDETLFEATVLEFPDVAVFEETFEEAYSVALEVIAGLVEMAEEMGHPSPLPRENKDRAYSGKITFRPGKRLHRQIADAASREDVSLNQWLCSVAAGAVAVQRQSPVPTIQAAGYRHFTVLSPQFALAEPRRADWYPLIRENLLSGAMPHMGARLGFNWGDDDESPTSVSSGTNVPLNLLIASSQRRSQ